MGSLRATGATLILLATTFAVATPATASGCWIEDAFVTDQELVGVGDTAAFLVIKQAGYSETCSPDDAEPWTFHCLANGAEEDTIDTPPVIVPEIRVLGQVVVPEQEVVPAQNIPIPTDPSLALLDDPMCSAFADEDFQHLVVSIRIEDEEDTHELESHEPWRFFIELATPYCGTPEGYEVVVCHNDREDLGIMFRTPIGRFQF